MASEFKNKIESILSDDEKLQAVSDRSFDKYDTDGSGYIEIKEFRKMIQDLYGRLGQKAPSKSEIHKMLGELDENGDQKLDKSEFKEHTRTILEGMIYGTLGM